MESIILTESQYESLEKTLTELRTKIANEDKSPAEKYIDNQEFILLMKISKRTAQSWRTAGKIGYSQIGNKFYYRLSDVEALLQSYYVKAMKVKSCLTASRR
ncbi:MAG: helix-turn-helix domain-containing protein [Bacteroidota bacterium]